MAASTVVIAAHRTESANTPAAGFDSYDLVFGEVG